MGRTLALSGAYNLAGAVTCYLDDHSTAFAEYEKQMRPIVDRAQKLVSGMPHLLHPETAWGVWTMNSIVSFLMWTRIAVLLFMFMGPPADTVPVAEYGFEQLPDLQA